MAADRAAGVRRIPTWRRGLAVWHAIGAAMGRVTTPILMTVFFLAVITPMALVLRLFRVVPRGPGAGEARGWIARRPDRVMDRDFLRPF